MKEIHWENLIKIIEGEVIKENPVGFIVDSPWLPKWYGSGIIDYYADPEVWFNSNMQAMKEFPEVMFLPGFWAEFGMSTEPSAFGSKLIWSENDFPHPGKISSNPENISGLLKPNVTTDGLLPFSINRMLRYEERIKQNGCRFRFATSRGPLNIASFLFGMTDFMLALAITPEEAQKGLTTITDFVIDWLSLQFERFRDIDGILILDDIIGFLGEPDFETFVLPHLKRIYSAFNAKVKFLHNDASGLICAKYLREIGVNLFNFSFNHSMGEIRSLTGDTVTLLGNIPPREILAMGSQEDVRASVRQMMTTCGVDHSRIIWSCGGGMAPDTPTSNIRAFIQAVKEEDYALSGIR
jgi:uroporphyrinogen-III decarboxylase